MFKKGIVYLNVFSFCWPTLCMAGMINPDGTTMTNVAVNGNRFDVTTGTVSGSSAFNSFSSFDVWQGKTANLHLPNGTNNLINLIHDKKTNIDGVLNAYKNGQIGGNVYLLNPNGIAVGETGIVNVGSIAMSTPTHYFMQQVIRDGVVSETATKAILAGDMPINKSGTVSVKGKIKALDKIAVQAGRVENRGEITAQTQLSDLVNTEGLPAEDAPLVFKKGKISIASETDVVNAGKVQVKGKSGQKTGKISIEAKNDIVLENGSHIVANGAGKESSGGDVYVMAQNDTTFEQGAIIEAKAGETGNGGSIELSAQKKVLLNGGTFDASAKNGQTGLVYIDPEEVVVNSQTKSDADIRIDGSIIRVEKNAVLDAQTNDIQILAQNKEGTGIAGITVDEGATLKGNNINLKAVSTVIANEMGLSNGEYNADLIGIGDLSLGLFGGVSDISSEAYIDIKEGAQLKARNDVNLSVESEAKIDMMAGPVVISAVFGAVENNARLTVNDNATITGDNINLSSIAKSGVSLTALTLAGHSLHLATNAAASFAYGTMKSTNAVDIGNATIKANNNLNIGAKTDKVMSVSASTVGLPESKAALDIAISTSDVKNTVSVGGKDISGQNVNIESEIYSVNSASASSSAGLGNLPTTIITGVKGIATGAMDKLLSKFGSKVEEKGAAKQAGKNEGKSAKIKVAGAVSYGDHINAAEASVKDNAVVSAREDVNVSAQITDVIMNSAEASVSAGTKDGNQSDNGVSAAVLVSDYENNTRSFIGQNAQVDAGHRLNVQASTILPPKFMSDGSSYFTVKEFLNSINGEFWDDFVSGAEMTFGLLMPHVNTNLGIKDEFFNTWAKSGTTLGTADSEHSAQKLAVTGSVNLTDYTNTTTAFISDNAKINQKNSAGNRVVDVNAATDVMGVNLAGNFGIPFGIEAQDGVGIGASFLQTDYNTTTGAFIGDNVLLNAEGLNVSAELENQDVSITFGLGSSENMGLSGMFSFLNTENMTLAQISGGAQINLTGTGKTDYKDASGHPYQDIFGNNRLYDQLYLTAKDNSLFVNVSGDVLKKQGGNSLSAATTVNNVDRLTHAVWGDIKTDLMNSSMLSRLKNTVKSGDVVLYDVEKAGAQTGYIAGKQDLNISAEGEGLNVAIAVAAGISTGSKPDVSAETNPADIKLEDSNKKPMDMTAKEAKGKGQFGMGISASFGWNKFDNDVAAYINNARTSDTQFSAANTKLHATDSTQSYAVTGDVSIEANKNNSSAATAAASASYNNINSTVRAFAENAAIWMRNGQLVIDAANHTKMMAAAIGGAFTGANNGFTASGAVNVNDINNVTQAFFKNSTIIAKGLDILALNDSWLWQTAVGITGSSNIGAGGVAGWNTVSGETSAKIIDTDVDTSEKVSLSAANESDIRSIVVGGAASKKGGVAISGAYNDIDQQTVAGVVNTSDREQPAVINTGALDVNARDDSNILAIATGAAWGQKLGASVVVAVNRIHNTAQTILDAARIMKTDKVSPIVVLNALSRGVIRSFANSIGVGTGEAAGIGSVGTYNDIRNTTESVVRNATIDGEGLIANAVDKSYILAETAGAGVSTASGALGVAVSINRIANETASLLENSQVSTRGDVVLSAKNEASNKMPENDKLPEEAGDLGDTSKRSITTVTVGGGLGLSGFGAGISGSYADVKNKTQSKIEGGTVIAGGDVDMNANNAAQIVSVAVTAAGGSSAGVSALSTTNIIQNQTDAIIGLNGENANQTTVKAVGNIDLNARNDAAISAVAAGLAIGGTAGVSGTVSYNDISNTTAARIRNAALSSVGSVGLTALSTDRTSFYYGMVNGAGTAGVGAMVGLNFLGNKAEATVDSSMINAAGQSALTNGKKGVALDAQTDDDISVYGGSLGVAGTVDVGGNVGLVDIANEAHATMSNSAVSSHVDSFEGSSGTIIPDRNAGLSLYAKNNADVMTVAGNAAIGGTAGVGASAATAVIGNRATAKLIQSEADVTGDTAIHAENITEYDSAVVTGAGSGTVGVAASVGIGLIENETTSLIDESRVQSRNLDVSAMSRTDVGKDKVLAVGGIVGAGTVGVGASVMVNQIKNETNAHIQNSSINTTDETEISATNKDNVEDYVVTGGVGGYVGVAGSVGVNHIDSTARAGIESNKTKISVNQSQHAVETKVGNLSISADNTTTVRSIMDTIIGAGIVGAGASVEATTVKGSAEAYIKGNQAVTSQYDIDVHATRNIDTQVGVVAGGAAGIAGVAGALSILNIGDGKYNTSEYTSGQTENGEIVGVDSMINDHLLYNKKALDSIQNQDFNMTGDVLGTNYQKGNFADIQIEPVDQTTTSTESNKHSASAVIDLKGQNLTARYGSVSVDSTENLTANQIVGSGAAGYMAVGASVGVLNAHTNTLAKIENTVVHAGQNVDVNATLKKQDIKGDVYVAGAAVGGAANGSVNVANVQNTTEAVLGEGTRIAKARDVAVHAKAISDIVRKTLGVTASGFAGVGASVSTINKSGETNAFVADGVKIGYDSNERLNAIRDLTIQAENETEATAEAIAATGGAAAAVNGTVATVSQTDKTRAVVQDNAKIAATKDVKVQTNSSQQINANTIGVAAGVVGVGASVSTAEMTLDNQASLGDNVSISGAHLDVDAFQSQANANAQALSASGAFLLGVNGAVGTSSVKGIVQTQIGKNTNLTIRDKASFVSKANSGAYTDVSGVQAGIIAVGATVGVASNDVTTETVLKDGQLIDTNTLEVSAIADTTVESKVMSGAGGVVSGAAAVANTKNTSTVRTVIGEGTAKNKYAVETLAIKAQQTIHQNGFADSINAAVVGASGAVVHNESTSSAVVDLKGINQIQANDVTIEASNTYQKESDDYNVNSGSGGLVDLPAARSETTTTHTASVDFGAGLSLTRNLEKIKAGKRNDYGFTVSAMNNVQAADKVKLVSGGAIPVATVVSKINDTSHASITLDNATIVSVNDIIMNAAGNVNIHADGAASTYGLASGAGGDVEAIENQTNTISLKNGGNVYAGKNLYLNAGQAKGDESKTASVTALSQLWNNSAIPISSNSATARLNYTNLIDVAAQSSTRSGMDSYLTSQHGKTYVVGQADSHNPYNEAFSTDASYYDGQLNNDSRINVDGSVKAGVDNVKNIVIDQNGVVTVNGKTDEASYYYTEEQVSLYAEMEEEWTHLKKMLNDYGQNEEYKNYYTAELAALEAKMASMGLLTYHEDAAGNKQTAIRKDVIADYIKINNIQASAGAVELVTESLTGAESGLVSASSGAEISIKNNSAKFLKVNDLIINERPSGVVRLNYQDISENKPSAFNGTINLTDGEVQAQNIHILSTYSGQTDNGQTRGPSIDIVGNVVNYNGDVVIENRTGSIYTSGGIRGKNISVTSNGDIIQKSNALVTHVGSDPSALWDEIAKAHENGTQTEAVKDDISTGEVRSEYSASNNIFLSGRYLNLNGLIQSGTADWNLNINDDNLVLVGNNGSLTVANALADYQAKIKKDPKASELYALSKDVHGNVNAFYNVLTGQVEINDIRVQGGYIELNGHILNTNSKGGELRVTDGYGRLNITNNSAYDIVLNDIEMGNKINGMIKITDTAQKDNNGNYLTTIYTRNGNTITAQVSGSNAKNITAAVDSNGLSSTTYDVLDGQRYQWLTGQEKVSERETIYNTSTFWGIDWLSPDKDKITSQKTWEKDKIPLREGDGVVIGSTNENAYDFSQKDVTLNDWERTGYEQWTEKNGWWILSTTEHFTKITEQQGTKTYNEHSIKADNNVKISFQGFDSASTNIQSKSNIYLQGDVNNQNGTAQITSTSGAIDSLSGLSQIKADRIQLRAETGIGDKNGVEIQLTNNGLLSAVNGTSGNIHLTSSSDIVFDQIANNGTGDTIVNSKMNIIGQDNQAYIKGKGIDLTAEYGQISTKDGGLLHIYTDANAGGTLSATAGKDILLTQTVGDLGIKRIVAEGDVKLDVAGSVFDANENQQENLQTVEELERRWADMGLDKREGAVLDEAISAYENQKTAEYREYWEIKHGLNETGDFAYTEVQKQALLASGLTSSEIADMEAARTKRFAELDAVYGATSYDANYRYIASVEDKSMLAEGAGWNASQLEFAFEESKLDSNVGTQIEIEEANITGQNVTVVAGGSIGKENGEIVLNVDDMANWSRDEKLLFSAAERDNVHVSEDGKTVTVSLREDVDIHAKGALNLKASDNIYLGAEQDINVDTIQSGAGKDITIAGAGGIYNVSTTDKPNVIGNNLVLEAAKGDIGASDKALSIDLTGKVNARASGSIYLTANDSVHKNMAVDYIYAPEKVALFADDITDARQDKLVNIRSHLIELNAANIGTSEDALDVTLDDKEGALLKATATGSVYLNNAEEQDLAVDVVAQNAVISADNGNLSAQRVETSEDAILTATNGNITADTITSGGNVSLTSGNGTIVADAIDSGNQVLISTQNGDIQANHISAQNDVAITTEQGNITLKDVVSNMASATVETLKGMLSFENIFAKTNAYVKALNGLVKGNTVIADTGAATINGEQGVSVDTVLAGTDATVNVTDGDTSITNMTAGNDATVSVDQGDTTIGTLMATAGTANISVGTGTTSIDKVNAGTDAVVNVKDGATTITNMTAGNDTTVSVEQGDMTIGTLTATAGTANVSVGAGTTSIDTVNAGTDAVVNVMDGATSITNMTAGNVTTVSVEQGDTTIGTLTATAGTTNVSVGTGTTLIETVSAGIDAVVNVADGDTSITNMTAGNDTTVSVEQGDTTITSMTAGNDVAIKNITGNVIADELVAGQDVVLDTGDGSVELSQTTAGNDVTVTNKTGDVTVIDMTANANVSINMQSGDLGIGQIQSGNHIALSTQEGSVDGLTNDTTLVAHTVNFETVGGTIGQADHVMKVEADKVDGQARENIWLDLTAQNPVATESTFGTIESTDGDIYLTSQNENVALTGEIRAHQGHVDIVAQGSIIDRIQSENGTIQSNTLQVSAQNGQVGSSDAYLFVDSSYTDKGWVDAMAEKGIFINEVNGPLNMRHFVSQNDINIEIDGDIEGAEIGSDEAHVVAKNITLHSRNGHIGTQENLLVLQTDDSLPGFINLKAAHDIAFKKQTPDLWSEYLQTTQDGNIMAVLPFGKMRIENLSPAGQADLILGDGGKYENIWISRQDVESKAIDSKSMKDARPIHITDKVKDFSDKYRIRYQDGNNNEQEQEEWLNGLLSFLVENNKKKTKSTF